MHAIIQVTLNRARQSFPRGGATSRANYEDLMENACDNTSAVKQSHTELPKRRGKIKSEL